MQYIEHFSYIGYNFLYLIMIIRRSIMSIKNKKHLLCLFALIILSLYTPLSYINAEKHVSFKITLPKDEILMIPSGIQHIPSGYSFKKYLFTHKPMIKHIRFLLNSILIIEWFICTLFIRVIINKRKLIQERCVVKFHGSKYKFFILSF